MGDLTKKLSIVGFALLTLTASSLEAQKHKEDNYCSSKGIKHHDADFYAKNLNRSYFMSNFNFFKKKNDSYCSSESGRNYNKNVYSKNPIGKPVFLNKDARHYSRKVYSNRMHDNFKGIARQEKRYHTHLHN
jgi:hypothetical protein